MKKELGINIGKTLVDHMAYAEPRTPPMGGIKSQIPGRDDSDLDLAPKGFSEQES